MLAIRVWMHKALQGLMWGGHLLAVLQVGAYAHSRLQRRLADHWFQAPFTLTWHLSNVVLKILLSRLAPLLSRASHCLAGACRTGCVCVGGGRGKDAGTQRVPGGGARGSKTETGGHQGRPSKKRRRVAAATACPAGLPPRRRPAWRLAAAVPPWPASE